MTRTCLAFVLLAACGGSSSSKTPDAPPVNPDAAVDAPAMAQGAHSHYVVDKVIVPTTSAQAKMYGLDLNGDGTVDNELGSVLATLSSMGANLQASVDHAVAVGDILMLADVQTSAFDNASDAGFTLYTGQNPNPAPCLNAQDTVCGQHLQGTGSFDVAAMPRDTPLVGAFASGTYTGGPGHLPLQISVLAGSMPLTLDLIGARVKFDATSTNLTSGIIAGAVSQNDLDTKVFPAVQVSLSAQVAADCTNLTSPPGCGCASGSTGATLIGLFDANHDCAISVDEIKNNTLIQSLFAPDVTIEGMPALSAGVGFTAVPATFTP